MSFRSSSRSVNSTFTKYIISVGRRKLPQKHSIFILRFLHSNLLWNHLCITRNIFSFDAKFVNDYPLLTKKNKNSWKITLFSFGTPNVLKQCMYHKWYFQRFVRRSSVFSVWSSGGYYFSHTLSSSFQTYFLYFVN